MVVGSVRYSDGQCSIDRSVHDVLRRLVHKTKMCEMDVNSQPCLERIASHCITM